MLIPPKLCLTWRLTFDLPIKTPLSLVTDITSLPPKATTDRHPRHQCRISILPRAVIRLKATLRHSSTARPAIRHRRSSMVLRKATRHLNSSSALLPASILHSNKDMELRHQDSMALLLQGLRRGNTARLHQLNMVRRLCNIMEAARLHPLL